MNSKSWRPPNKSAAKGGFMSFFNSDLRSAFFSGSTVFLTATSVNMLLPAVSHLAQWTVCYESCHLSDDLITFYLTQIPPTKTSPAHIPLHINHVHWLPSTSLLHTLLNQQPVHNLHFIYLWTPKLFTQHYMPWLAYLLCSLQQRQMDVWHNVRQSAPFSHAQSAGQLHVPIHHRQVWVIWVAYRKEATIQVHLMYNIMLHTF